MTDDPSFRELVKEEDEGSENKSTFSGSVKGHGSAYDEITIGLIVAQWLERRSIWGKQSLRAC